MFSADVNTAAAPEPLILNQLDPTPAERVLEGPANTLILGLRDGLVELWGLSEGRRLDAFDMDSSVTDLTLHNNTLFATSERGETLTLDLNPLTIPYCEFLSQLWSVQPASWSDGQTLLAPIDPEHPCAAQHTASPPTPLP